MKRLKAKLKTRGLVFVVLALLIASVGTAYADYFGGRYADTATHTWWNGAARSYDVPIWGPINEDIMYDEIEAKTVIDAIKVSYHYKAGLTYPWVDFSWWAADLQAPRGGSATCDEPIGSSRCDHFHVIYDDDPGQTTNSKRQKVCHELLHTLGADDGSTAGGCMGGGPDGTLNSHDIGHIDGYYTP